MSRGGAYKRTGTQGAADFRKDVRIYDPRDKFNKAVYRACEFGRMQPGPVFMLDAMSGPGKLGGMVNRAFGEESSNGGHRHKRLNLSFNDIREEPLMQLKADGFQTLHCDVRELGDVAKKHFHVIVVRFGLKDFPMEQKRDAIMSLHKALVRGCRLVIADMYAHSPESQQALNAIHAAKQELAGRNKETEGECFIPTAEEWTGLLEGAFMPVKVTYKGMSNVDISQWRGQFGPDADDDKVLLKLDEMITRITMGNRQFEEECIVQLDPDHKHSRILFPVLVITADRL